MEFLTWNFRREKLAWLGVGDLVTPVNGYPSRDTKVSASASSAAIRDNSMTLHNLLRVIYNLRGSRITTLGISSDAG